MDKTIGYNATMKPDKVRNERKAFAPGDVIAGRYVVECVLGEGGMGIVYQCLDRVGGVKVAVKCLPPEVSRSGDEIEEIRSNYRIVADLHHPNIAGARTLELDEATGDYYLVMDLAQGESLKRWMRRTPNASMETKLSILRQVAAALDYAHSKKVIHRDVKPENVMVDDEGGVKVLDFGLAAQIRSSQSRTTGVVSSTSGSPGYKSPEQWLGSPQSAPADVYAFGVMAYWMFAGVLPFDGDNMAVLCQAVLTAPVRPIAGLPVHMNAALVKALAKTPEDRFTSCGAVVDALEGKDFGRVEHVERVDGNGTPRTPPGGPRPVAALKALLAVAALALVAVGGWWWTAARSDKNDATNRGHCSLPASAKTRTTTTLTLPGGTTMEMIYCEPGTFTMGSPITETCHKDDETQHEVVLTKGFWLSKYEVTQRQWKSVMNTNPSSSKDDDHPVENVSWNDCQNFIAKVNESLHCGARLPTEAEWEYACRAGTIGAYGGSGKLYDMGWFYDNSGWHNSSWFRDKHPVGRMQPNAWGFYDMHGNVWEWCEDRYGNYPKGSVTDPTGPDSGDGRVLRGGSAYRNAGLCRSAHRRWDKPDKRYGDNGFRLCCSAEPRTDLKNAK